MDTAVVFDLWGPLAVYRKFYTNSSVLSYAFPPPTAVRGLVGAIVGIDKSKYAAELKDMEVAVSLKHVKKTLHMTLNYIKTIDGENALGKGRTQIPVEIIKDPYYCIYVRKLPQQIKEQLVTMLSEHRTVFTPYLGMSEMIANFKFIGEYEIEENNGSAVVDSIVPAKTIDVEKIRENGNKLGKERIPFYLDANKKPLSYMDIAYDVNAKPIPMKGSYSIVGKVPVKFLTSENIVKST
ncbi:type I-B CRISPR-associated protein Cas5b [Coprothermobacter platensis]|uniref:type I-B CRISPR-associated protein Cas5b n=1 Tax=Coprothermobacter platensis TaxID=108819 RepID=UPI000366FECB|nr:type I-B CRISPR-associated protein Cas5b [Coprothermobacter platensis]